MLRGWAILLAAAAAVLVAVAVPLAVFRGQATTATHGTAGGPASGPGGTPPYYLAAPGHHAVITSTATGKALVLLRPPTRDRSLSAVGAAASDRAFVLGVAATSKPDPPSSFFLVRFHPRTRTASLTRLPVHLNFGGKPGRDGQHAAMERELDHCEAGGIRGQDRIDKGVVGGPYASSAIWSANSRQVQVAWQDTRTGHLSHVLGPVRQAEVTPLVQWASDNGRVLIISGKDGGLGVLHDGRYRPLPLGILRNQMVADAVW